MSGRARVLQGRGSKGYVRMYTVQSYRVGTWVQQCWALSTYWTGPSPTARPWPVLEVYSTASKRPTLVLVASSCLPDPLSFLSSPLFVSSIQDPIFAAATRRSDRSRARSVAMARCRHLHLLLALFLALAAAAAPVRSFTFFFLFPFRCVFTCRWRWCSSPVVSRGRGRRRVTGKPPPSSSMPRLTATCGTSKPTTRFRTKFPHPSSLWEEKRNQRICLDLF